MLVRNRGLMVVMRAEEKRCYWGAEDVGRVAERGRGAGASGRGRRAGDVGRACSWSRCWVQERAGASGGGRYGDAGLGVYDVVVCLCATAFRRVTRF